MGCGASKQQGNVVADTGPPPVNYGERTDGPRDAYCHICGRKYTVHSINIHIPQCEKLFQERQELLPRAERKPVPKLPNEVAKMDIQERNKVALEIYNDAVMAKCEYCGRTFLPDRLSVHIKSCARNHGKEYTPPDKKATYHTGPTQAKNTVVCHICGRNYTTHSIDIHLPQCEKKFEQEQAKLPKARRKPMPQLPPKAKKASLEERNAMATKVYNDHALEACQYCGRTFLPDRLEVHLRSCERNHAKT